MSIGSQTKNLVGKDLKPLRINTIRNLLIVVLLAVCSTAYVFPATHPVPSEKNGEGANCLDCPAVNPEVKPQGQSNYWLSETQRLVVLERA